jgi:hypothetical protein
VQVLPSLTAGTLCSQLLFEHMATQQLPCCRPRHKLHQVAAAASHNATGGTSHPTARHVLHAGPSCTPVQPPSLYMCNLTRTHICSCIIHTHTHHHQGLQHMLPKAISTHNKLPAAAEPCRVQSNPSAAVPMHQFLLQSTLMGTHTTATVCVCQVGPRAESHTYDPTDTHKMRQAQRVWCSGIGPSPHPVLYEQSPVCAGRCSSDGPKTKLAHVHNMLCKGVCRPSKRHICGPAQPHIDIPAQRNADSIRPPKRFCITGQVRVGVEAIYRAAQHAGAHRWHNPQVHLAV